MPQFDFTNVFWPQLFWLALFFIVLYFGIVRLTLPRLGKVMDERAAKIDGDLEAARAAKESADELTERYRAELEKSRDEARSNIAAAKAEAAKASEVRLARADAESAAQIEAAEARIADASAKAHGSLRGVAVEGAQAIVAKLTGSEPSADAVSSAVDAAMAR
ncbi:ATPase [Altererythrobacter sp. FM1]|uniref:F0F1 ATP synthase subunit B family protein n=1 Tax=Tsuneonella flava TaxID=2055955 RepID=UPI000C8102FB|nr:ATPase [Tsuneonella flava]ROT95085.1 ATPase [Altererythrobacter sp. FM1]